MLIAINRRTFRTMSRKEISMLLAAGYRLQVVE